MDAANEKVSATDDLSPHRNSAAKSVVRLITWMGCITAAFHLVSALLPSSMNWGAHHLAFFPAYVRIGIPVLMLVALIPRVQLLMLNGLNVLAAGNWLRRNSRTAALVLLSGVCAWIFWLLRQRTYFLGDGFMIVRWLASAKEQSDIPVLFQNEPLVGQMFWKVSLWLTSLHLPADAADVIQYFSIAFGTGCVIMTIILARTLFSEPLDRLLCSLFLLTSGASQLFFGYVENYTPAYFGVLLYCILSILYLRGKISPVVVGALFGILFASYFGILVLFPSLLLLIFHGFRSGKPGQAVATGAVALATAAMLLWMCGYSLQMLGDSIFHGESHLVPIVQSESRWKAYTMFSIFHVSEVWNLYMLVSPFTIIILVTAIIVGYRNLIRANWEMAYLTSIGCLGILFTLIVNTDIGMSRDWDLLSPFVVCGMISAAALLGAVLDRQRSRRIMIMTAAIMCLHTIPWVMMNADQDKSLARFSLLPDERTWGRNAFKVYEELGMYYRTRDNIPLAVQYYLKYLDYDSTDARILGNLGEMYRALGDVEREERYYRKAVEYRTRVAAVYVNLGLVYADQERFDEALDLMKDGLSRNPDLPGIATNVGLLLMKVKGAYGEALPYLQRALARDSNDARACMGSSLCAYNVGDTTLARKYLRKYMELQPGDLQAREFDKNIKLMGQPSLFLK